MIRYKIGSGASGVSIGENVAPRIEDVVNAIVASGENDDIVELSFGSRYVFPERRGVSWKCVTYIMGRNKSGKSLSIGICDYSGPAKFGQVLFGKKQ